MIISSTELHNKLLSIMISFHDFCVENEIKYYLLGGSALGARRHKGFIPWDDDIDIGIPRDDYDRLAQMDPSCLPENLELRFYQNTKDSPFHFMKLIDKSTTLIEHQYKGYIEGLYVDIFPLDGAANNSLFEKIRRHNIWNTHTLLILHFLSETKSHFIKRIIQQFARLVPANVIHNSLEKQMTRYTFEDSQDIANYLGSWKEREIMPKSILGTPTLYDFEGVKFFGPQDIDSYLRHLYGDYMKLPPEEDRIFKHDYYYLNLDLPYNVYQE